MKHTNTGSSDGEIAEMAKIIQLLMKMEADIIEEQGVFAFMPEFERTQLVRIQVRGYVYAT